MRRSVVRFSLPAAAALLAFAAPLGAQSVSAVSLGGGVTNYDLSGVGTVPSFNLRAEAPLSRNFVLEPGVMFFRPELQGGGDATLLIPEVQGQLQLPLGPVAPYVGAGLGVALGWGPADRGGFETELAPSAGVGLRVDYGGLLGFVIDGRIHGMGWDLDGGATEVTVGVRLRR